MTRERRGISRILLGAAVVAAVLALGLFLILPGLSDFDLDARATREISFDTPSSRLSGTLFLPDAPQAPAAVALLVHGDGPQDRVSAGGYLPLMTALLDSGIAVYSWDKPGVGKSQGNWLDQSMDDRASEAEAALRAVLRDYPQARGRIGLLGFSQAGWVLPQVGGGPAAAEIAFIVSIGAALDWQRQGAYFTRRRLQAEGWSPERIAEHIASRRQTEERIFADVDAGRLESTAAAHDLGIPPHRLEFVRRNLSSNASADLARVGRPYLALWGAEDLNVDARANADDARRLVLANNPANRVTVIPSATHSLLRDGLFNHQLAEQWPWYTRAAFVLLGRRAYADGAVKTITDWLHAVVGQGDKPRAGLTAAASSAA
jgi:alpha-beta hydrolase superfamily lysophospholipase